MTEPATLTEEQPMATIYEGDLRDADYQHFIGCTYIGVDTETRGLNPRRDRLCLVQISDGDKVTVCIKIDRQALRDGRRYPNIEKLMGHPDVRKVFHFARFDVAFLMNWLQIGIFRNVFCTKVASKLTRTYGDPRHSLKDTLNDVLGIQIDKGFAQTNWDRELTASQIKYACEDVIHLPALAQQLERNLTAENRILLAKKAMECIPTIAELDVQEFVGLFEHA